MATWSGFWNYVYDDGYAGTAGMRGIHFRRALRTAMRNYHNPYNRVISAIVQGVGTAYGDYRRVQAQDTNDIPLLGLGGVRPTENKIAINRAIVVPGDANAIRADLYNQKWYTPNNQLGRQWPVDKSGNGSGQTAGTRGL